MVKGF